MSMDFVVKKTQIYFLSDYRSEIADCKKELCKAKKPKQPSVFHNDWGYFLLVVLFCLN